MKWSFENLQGYKDKPYEESAVLDLKQDLKERYPDEILDATPLNVSISSIANDGDVIIDADIKGSITVPSSRSLVPVEIPLDFHVNEVYVNTNAALNRYDEEVVALLIDESGMIDFDKAVVDNVIVQIPMQVLSPDEKNGKQMPSGNDWNVVSEDDFDHQKENAKKVDPRFASLKNFYSSNNDET
ncbi:nucleotide-binding protein [Fructilactobacillus lindneri]|uniref:Metal-binding protein n=2 Tax=Fructilactobacillus lindneri TaxID=53444 RepID=A0A0R2JYD3_9LACO|nr:DUF177 domain-containing protein [Fructilactobacillus lindneri]ANZ58258.1 nucleotide-binding protein [Fructilactobacillus lindneri]ANZ59580.1 nucleotide-binding protein [Fructilactobacillus lindneri]KRN79085.1 hypothetical protein IV52_GL000490 [Fructilactobacillus lindneri DSM 20690 = JCM 11027]POG98636.1 nucleotide-binding protein [Fructilactobacillus lindneri]POH04024.1 nucleotide-binding protein [Fructilactobacillus lindneri]